MKKYSLHFDGVLELIKCVKEIEKAHLAIREEKQKMLSNLNVTYGLIEPFGLAIDIDSISEEDLSKILNHKNEIIDRVYNELGITKNA